MIFHTIDDRERPSRGVQVVPRYSGWVPHYDAHTRMGGAMLRVAASPARSSVRMFGCGCSVHHHYMVRVQLWAGFAENKIKNKTKQANKQ